MSKIINLCSLNLSFELTAELRSKEATPSVRTAPETIAAAADSKAPKHRESPQTHLGSVSRLNFILKTSVTYSWPNVVRISGRVEVQSCSRRGSVCFAVGADARAVRDGTGFAKPQVEQNQ